MSPSPKPTRSDVPSESVVLVDKDAPGNEFIQIGPLKLEVLEDGRNTDNRLGALYIHVPPHTPGPPQHWHQMHDESFLVIKGTCTFTSRDKKVIAKQGSYVVVPPNSPHTFANDTDSDLLLYATCTPAYYINYFRLMAEMGKNGVDIDGSGESKPRITPGMVKRAMSNYATIQVRPSYDWAKGNGEGLATDPDYWS